MTGLNESFLVIICVSATQLVSLLALSTQHRTVCCRRYQLTALCLSLYEILWSIKVKRIVASHVGENPFWIADNLKLDLLKTERNWWQKLHED